MLGGPVGGRTSRIVSSTGELIGSRVGATYVSMLLVTLRAAAVFRAAAATAVRNSFGVTLSPILRVICGDAEHRRAKRERAFSVHGCVHVQERLFGAERRGERL